ncbi:sulfatase-like hydrolase/transferase [Neobacillus vireti]|uniref:sulfatase-like hydrolase/transferase n=1 Tax=Neobacillus vireti TaxID=220686 RepID=UPI0030001B46
MVNKRKSQRPNVIVIMSDDHGHWALGSAGNTEIHTPNLDSLSKAGIRFENFFCASPVCSPARASFLTGRIPSQHGVHDWIRSGNVAKHELNPEIKNEPIFADENERIEYLHGIQAYTDILSKSGYQCGLSGKWHLGDSLNPQKGFSHWFTIARGGCNYYESDIVIDGDIKIETEYITDVITKDALSFIDKQAKTEDPFYLSVHYTAPHSPWEYGQHPKEMIDLYKDCPFESVPEEPNHPWQIDSAPRGEGEKRKELLQGYYAAITAMDRGIGEILNKLKEINLLEDTLIFFTSDNGMNMGHHGIWGKGNGTFPQNMFDTSVKVPTIVSRPGHIPAGVVNMDLLSHYDFMPTLLDYLGLKDEYAAERPGKSFAPLLRGESLNNPDDVVIYDEYGAVRMIRTQKWKYIHRYPYGPHELYHLVEDPEERHNLVNMESTLVIRESLKSKLDDWFVLYANPHKDGVRECVTGYGQLGLAGTFAKGRNNYKQRRNRNDY